MTIDRRTRTQSSTQNAEKLRIKSFEIHKIARVAAGMDVMRVLARCHPCVAGQSALQLARRDGVVHCACAPHSYRPTHSGPFLKLNTAARKVSNPATYCKYIPPPPHHLHTISTLSQHYLHTISTRSPHDLHTICTRSLHDLQTIST